MHVSTRYAFLSLFFGFILQPGHFFALATDAVDSSLKAFEEYDYPNLYDESIPMLWASRLVYSFAHLLKAGREGELDLGDTFPPEVLELYKNTRLDVRGLEGGDGLSFNRVLQIVKANADNLKEIESEEWEYVLSIIEKIQMVEDADERIDTLHLETFSSINAATECVYGVLKG